MRKRILRKRGGSRRGSAGASAPKLSRSGADARAMRSTGIIDTSGVLPGLKEKTITYGRGKDKKEFTVLVDEKTGKVPKDVLAMRFVNTQTGSRKGTERNIAIDIDEQAKTVYEGNEDPQKLAPWWAYPNESDVRGIDTPGSPYFQDLSAIEGKKAKAVQKRLAVIGGTKEQREKVRQYIEKGFSVREQQKLEGVLIEITEDVPQNAAGCYYSKLRGGYYLIRIHPNYVNSDTVVHELAHHLRMVDTERKSTLTRGRPNYRHKDIDLEEAATTAEATTRQKPYAAESTGYYYFIQGKENARHEDRALFTRQPVTKDPDGKISLHKNPQLVEKGLKGKRALKSVDENFKNSKIAHLNITGGSAEAIDQYYTIEREGKEPMQVHVYSPKGKKAPPEVKRGEKLYEWRDGRKVAIRT